MQEIEDSMRETQRKFGRDGLELRPFRGTAFGKARSLLWSLRYVAVHQHPAGNDAGKHAEQLEHLLRHAASDACLSVSFAFLRTCVYCLHVLTVQWEPREKLGNVSTCFLYLVSWFDLTQLHNIHARLRLKGFWCLATNGIEWLWILMTICLLMISISSIFSLFNGVRWGMLQNQSFHREDNHGNHQRHIAAPRGFDFVEYFLSRMCWKSFLG